jgi:ribosome modulation factor
MERMTPFRRGWEAFDDGYHFGQNYYSTKRARVQWCKGWKAAKASQKAAA